MCSAYTHTAVMHTGLNRGRAVRCFGRSVLRGDYREVEAEREGGLHLVVCCSMIYPGRVEAEKCFKRQTRETWGPVLSLTFVLCASENHCMVFFCCWDFHYTYVIHTCCPASSRYCFTCLSVSLPPLPLPPPSPSLSPFWITSTD